MRIDVSIQWTETAKSQIADLPAKVGKGIIKKIGALRDADPRRVGKPLVGPLQGCRRITYGRYRALFSVEEQPLADGDVLLRVTVRVVAVGIRKEHDKHDVYNVALKLIELGLIPTQNPTNDD